MGIDYPRPDNADGYEQLCLRLYRKLWKNESLQLYAKRGEKQDGIDIFDPLCTKPIRAVQCKLHEPHKTITPSDIKAEVKKAEKSDFNIDHYVIATTAKKSKNAQNTVAKLNQRPRKKFTVEIHFWEETCQQASELGRVMAELIIYGENILAGAALIAQAGTGPLVVNFAGDESADANEPYAAIEKLLDDRQLEVARHELDKLPDANAAESWTPDERYKLLRLHAKFELESGEFETAAQLFLQAHAASPELDQAKQNQVLAFYLLEDSEKAYAHAKQYVAEGLTTPVMVLRLIDCITSQEQLQEHASLIKTYVETDENINTALSNKYVQFGEFDDAYDAAERALKISPDSPHAHLAAAMSAHSASVNGELKQRRTHLQTALDHYDAAEPAAREQHFTNLVPEILVNRAKAKMLAGDQSGAAADYRAAVESAKRPTVYADPAIKFFLQEQDFDSAWELLDSLDRTNPESQYLTLVTEYHRGDTTERRAHINEMKVLAERNWDGAVDCRFQCVQWALELKENELAESCVPAAFRQEHAFQAHTMLAWIHLKSGDQHTAKDESAKALGESIQSARPEELRVLAHLFVELKDDANALGLLEQVTTTGVFDDDMKSLIYCAQRLERHDLLLRICRELRESGEQEEQLRTLEVQLLNQYAPGEALQLVDEFIQSSSTPSYFVAFKNMIAVRLNELEKLNLDPSSLPTPAQLSAAEAHLVVLPYVTAGMHAEALKFLYAQRRLHFEDEHAHGFYISFFLTYGSHTELTESSSTVVNDCAALLELDRGGQRWVVIEDEQPAASRDEFAASSEIGQVILGHKVGDVIELPGNLVQPVTGTIREIQTKYVRAFQDGIENFVQRFPGSSMLQQFQVGQGENFDPSVIIKNLEGRREHVEKCVEVYRDHPCSLYLFADSVGISELDAVKALAQHPNAQLKCRQTTSQEFEQAANEGIPCETVVLSISAIVTVALVDGWNYLDSKKRYVVSQLTSELIDGWIRTTSAERSQEGGVASLDESGQLVFRETTDAERTARLDELRGIRRAVDTHCEVVSSVAVAELAPDKRKLYTESLGIHNIEAMGVARDLGAVLWSDDHFVAIVGETDFGATSIWTQLALRCFVDSRSLSMDEFDLVTAKLVSWSYSTIIFNPATIIAAGVEAEWQTDAWPLSQCLAQIEKCPLHISAKARLVADLLRLLRRSNCIEMKQGAVIHAALNALGDARAVRWILRRLDVMFGIDIPSADFVRLELDYWLRLR
jgi:tetratricopeptide (TPR) repeat protein